MRSKAGCVTTPDPFNLAACDRRSGHTAVKFRDAVNTDIVRLGALRFAAQVDEAERDDGKSDQEQATHSAASPEGRVIGRAHAALTASAKRSNR